MGIPGQGRMVEVEEALRGGPRTRRQQRDLKKEGKDTKKAKNSKMKIFTRKSGQKMKG